MTAGNPEGYGDLRPTHVKRPHGGASPEWDVRLSSADKWFREPNRVS